MKILTIGDMHVTISNLEESSRLFDFISKTAIDKKVDQITFLGDLYHSHSNIRCEVANLLNKKLIMLSKTFPIVVLRGNHDMSDTKNPNSPDAFGILNYDIIEKTNIKIVREMAIINKIAYIGYCDNKESFLRFSNIAYTNGATKLLVAHQTFTGANYGNGFYSDEGIDPALVFQESIVSGHIHTSQQIGKCFYPGTPKYDTLTDANENKGIYLFTHNEDGSIINREFISTSSVVTPILKYTIHEGEELPKDINENAKVYIELVGRSEWITKFKKELKGKYHIKAKPLDRKINTESKDKLDDIFSYAENFNFTVNKELVLNYLRGLNG